MIPKVLQPKRDVLRIGSGGALTVGNNFLWLPIGIPCRVTDYFFRLGGGTSAAFGLYLVNEGTVLWSQAITATTARAAGDLDLVFASDSHLYIHITAVSGSPHSLLGGLGYYPLED